MVAFIPEWDGECECLYWVQITLCRRILGYDCGRVKGNAITRLFAFFGVLGFIGRLVLQFLILAVCGVESLAKWGKGI
jgi:hypothetical protein